MGKSERIAVKGAFKRDLPDRRGDLDFKARRQQSAEAKRKLLQACKEASTQAKAKTSPE